MSIRYNDDFKKEVVKAYMARDKSTVQIAADYKNHIGNRHGGPIVSLSRWLPAILHCPVLILPAMMRSPLLS